MASRTSLPSERSSVTGRLLQYLGYSVLAGLLTAALLLPLAGLAGAGASVGREMLVQLPDELPSEPISVPSRLLSADGEEIATFYEENRTPVPLSEISPHMQHAIVAIEDERFYKHEGVDARGLLRAMVNNATSDSEQGASTLTQQFVNNMLVNAQIARGSSRLTISGTKLVSDKVKEIRLAASVERRMSKDEILEGYLNLVLFSGRAYGVEAASQYVFGKHASELQPWEAATLAGMVQSPTAFNPGRNPEAATARRNLVLDAMLRNGYLSQEEHDHAVKQPMKVVMKSRPSGCLNASFGAYFCDYVQRQILADPTFGPDVTSRQALLDRGGLTIRTTLDSKLQKKAEETLRAQMPNNESLGAGHSLTSVVPGKGEIRVMAQNTEYAVQDSLGHTSLNLNVDRKWGGGEGFQAGSTLKPFTALTWLRTGNHLIDTVDGSRNLYPAGTRFQASCRPGGYVSLGSPWGPINNVVGGLLAQDRLDEGLYYSVNTPTVATAYQLDLCDITSLLTQLGITRAADSSPIQPDDPSFLLGKDSIAPLSLAAAYAALGADGLYCAPRAMLEVTDATGSQYDLGEPECRQVIDPDHVAELTPVLRHIAAAAVDPSFGVEMGAKTGTNNNVSSTWFIGYTRTLSTAVWSGRYTSLQTMTGETIGGVKREQFYVNSLNAPAWKAVNELAKKSDPPGPLPVFDGPQSLDPGAPGRHPDGHVFTVDDIDRGGPQPEAVPGG